LKDAPFQDSVEALQKWEQEFHQRCESILGDGTVNRDEFVASPDDGVKLAFKHAEFINEFFSLPLLKAAVDESTDDDLIAVWNDMHVMRERAFV
jgi:hypothetical protein